MLYCFINNQEISEPSPLPINYHNISSFYLLDPAIVEFYGFYPFQETEVPEYNPLTHKVVKTLTLSSGVVSYSYSVEQMSQEEAMAVFAEKRNQLYITLDNYLDAVVQAQGFKNILSACTYANSANLSNKTLGEAVINWRDDVWDTVAKIESDVINGLRTPPTESQLLQELPAIEWPQ